MRTASIPPAAATKSAPPLAAAEPEGKLPFFPYRFMAVDVGSNAIKYRAWEIEQKGSLRQLLDKRYPIRLGRGTFHKGILSEKDMQAAVKAFESIRQDYESMEIHAMRAVATSAMREASNSLTLLSRVARKTGIHVEILPAAEEARLIAMGVFGTRLQLSEQYLLIEIGGGSTEIILASGTDLVSALSIRLGAVRLKEMFFPKSPAAPDQLGLAETHIRDVLVKTLHLPALTPSAHCMGSAGTIMALRGMTQTLSGPKGADGKVHLSEMNAIIAKLKSLSHEAIARQFALDPQRSEVILPGALVLRAIMRQLDLESVEPVRGGVSDGILHAFLERAGLRRSRLFDHDRAFLIQALALGEHYRFNRDHAQQVLDLAISIFDQLQPLHGLGPVHRWILKGAALLHEIGQFLSFADHHKHSYYFILHSDLPGLSESEKLILACVARYHRKSHPKSNHEGYSLLDKQKREQVRRLAAILRIADALDREQQSLVSRIRIQLTPKEVEFHISVRDQAAIEVWAAEQKGTLFKETFGLTPRFIIE